MNNNTDGKTPTPCFFIELYEIEHTPGMWQHVFYSLSHMSLVTNTFGSDVKGLFPILFISSVFWKICWFAFLQRITRKSDTTLMSVG